MTRLIATYRLRGPDPAARARAIAVEQSIEMPPEAVAAPRILTEVLGEVLDIKDRGGGVADARIALATETIGADAGQLLNMLFGNTSLHPDVSLIDARLPPAAKRWARAARPAGSNPCGFSAEPVSARPSTPNRARRPAIPWRGPPNTAASAPGSAIPTRVTSGCSEVLPNSMFSNCPPSVPTVSAASAIRASNTPPPRSATSSTRPTTSARMRGASIAASGISTLCSTAIAAARAAMVAPVARMR